MQGADTVALGVTLTAVGGQVTVRPMLGLITDDSRIVPAKLLTLVSATETDAEAPELKFTGVGEDIATSPTWTKELAEWDAVPGDPEPVTAAT